MIELLVLAGVGLFVALVVGAVMLHVLLALILIPFKLGLLLLKGLFVGLVALPVAALGVALLVGMLAVAGVVGTAALILAAIF